jgi:amino acid adenylation domain-containing protein
MEFDPVLVHEWLSRSARRHPDKEALVCGEERWTYAALDRHSSLLAHSLVNMGVARHDCVAVFMESSPQAIVAIYGILKAGAVFVLLNAAVRAPKLRYVLRDSRARVLIADRAGSEIVAEALDGDGAARQLIWSGGIPAAPPGPAELSIAWSAVCCDGGGSGHDAQSLPRIIDTDLAALIYTSGSTGEPKGVMCTHRNMVCAARSIIQYIGNEADDVILNALPLSFDYGLYQVIMAFMFGGTVVLEQSFVYLHKSLQLFPRERVTGWPVVPTILAMFLNLRDPSRYDLGSLRYLTNTGAPLPAAHIRRFRAMFPHVRVFSMFGLTECKRVGYLPPGEIDRRPGSVGVAMPNCEAFVVDEDGREVPPGSEGELVVRGGNVMQGYWNDEAATAAAYRPGSHADDRRLHSGDRFRKDADGFLYFLGRTDDMIKSRGERISPAEVEAAIAGVAGVAEVTVVGLPDDIMGQVLKAFVVLQPGATVNEHTIRKHCARNLEPLMVPKTVSFVAALPRTAHGKIDRKSLCEDGKRKA